MQDVHVQPSNEKANKFLQSVGIVVDFQPVPQQKENTEQNNLSKTRSALGTTSTSKQTQRPQQLACLKQQYIQRMQIQSGQRTPRFLCHLFLIPLSLPLFLSLSFLSLPIFLSLLFLSFSPFLSLFLSFSVRPITYSSICPTSPSSPPPLRVNFFAAYLFFSSPSTSPETVP